MTDSRRVESESAPDVERQLMQFSQSLARLAQRHLDARLKSRLEGEDVVQSAFRTFLRRNARGEFQVEGTADLWRLLVRITVMKARAKGRYHTADRRNPRHEVHGDEWFSDLIAREPEAGEADSLVDTIDALLDGTPDWYASVLEMRLDDVSITEIADHLKLSRQSIHRALRVLKDRLQREGDLE
jgi:RNA polymerase sigma factor (sigma-70 family)